MVSAIAVERGIDDEGVVGVAPEVVERLSAYVADVTSGLGHVRQRSNAEVYIRGLIQVGA
jgi:hypothetical protein